MTDKSVFYHVPKTGGVWVKEAMRGGGLEYARCHNRKVGHPFGLKREHATPAIIVESCHAGRFSFCFVRHPIEWYRSFWAYRTKTGRLDPKFPPDRVWDDDFAQFVNNVLDAFPNGFVTQLYQYYVGTNGKQVDFIGKQERLADDLVQALSLAGEEFNEAGLRAARWQNVAAGHKKFGAMCQPDETTRERILEAEKWVMETFYV